MACKQKGSSCNVLLTVPRRYFHCGICCLIVVLGGHCLALWSPSLGKRELVALHFTDL